MEKRQIGLVAGRGRISVILARTMKENNIEVIAVAMAKDIAEEIKDHVDKVYTINATQIGKIISTFKKEGIKELLMVGKVEKNLLFKDTKIIHQ